jgi:hypothetical protein
MILPDTEASWIISTKKIDLLKTASYNADEETMRTEIWLGLLPEFQVQIPQLGRVLNEKDLVYRELLVRRVRKEERRDWRKKERNLGPNSLVDTTERVKVLLKLNLVRPMLNLRNQLPTNAERNLRKGILLTLRIYLAINGERIWKVVL